jgi:YVTN family beta-propeller protein
MTIEIMLVILDNKIFVTNWGGKLTDPDNDVVSRGGWNDKKAGFIKINSKTESSSSGTVSVMDENGDVIKIVNVGLHPNDIIANKKGTKVYVSNANSDTVSIIDTKTYKVENIVVSLGDLDIRWKKLQLKLSLLILILSL